MTSEKLTEMCRRVGDIREQFARASVTPPWELTYLHDSLLGIERISGTKLYAAEREFFQKNAEQLLRDFVPRAVAAMEKRLTAEQQIRAQKAQNVVDALVRLADANKPVDVEQLTAMCRYLQATHRGLNCSSGYRTFSSRTTRSKPPETKQQA